jgi:GDP-L-fucose synthase
VGSTHNLLVRAEAQTLIEQEVNRSGYVAHLAYPGSRYGIETSVKTPFTLASDLVQMDLNMIQACVGLGVAKLLGMGSACSYPERTVLPTVEQDLWHGYPEPVNAAYGLAKRTQLMLLQAARQEHGLNGVHLITANMYGPGDTSGHVIPSLITRMRVAQRDGVPLVVWGDPAVTRSFLYVEDAAEGVCRALADYDSGEPLNLVSPVEVSMGVLVARLANRLGFTGAITWDATKPTGHRRRRFSTTALHAALGWVPSTTLSDGLGATVAWHLAYVALPTREEA